MNEPDTIKVRFAGTDDIDAMAAIYAESFEDFQPKLAVEQYLRPRGSWALLAFSTLEDQAKPAGFIITRCAADEAEVFSIGVARKFRRHGIGLVLLDAMNGVAAIQGAREVFLEVGIDNQAARALYSKAGYEIVGQRPDYYRNPGGGRVTALILRRQLENIQNLNTQHM